MPKLHFKAGNGRAKNKYNTILQSIRDKWGNVQLFGLRVPLPTEPSCRDDCDEKRGGLNNFTL